MFSSTGCAANAHRWSCWSSCALNDMHRSFCTDPSKETFCTRIAFLFHGNSLPGVPSSWRVFLWKELLDWTIMNSEIVGNPASYLSRFHGSSSFCIRRRTIDFFVWVSVFIRISTITGISSLNAVSSALAVGSVDSAVAASCFKRDLCNILK